MIHCKYILCIFFLFLAKFQLDAQTIINGTVTDESNQALEYASIDLYTLDTTWIDGVSTDSSGNFSLSTTEKNVLLVASFISLEEQWFSLSDFTTSYQHPTIRLTSSSLELTEVGVEATRRAVSFELDKKVYNTSDDPLNAGASASDILDNIPSVDVDADGNISMRSSSNVKVLIDGKPTGLSAGDALARLQGNMIDRIEIITTPSAKYAAQGDGGIINIILKKQDNKGLNGSFDLHLGTPHDYGIGVNLNRRKNNINLFSTVGLNYRNFPGNEQVKQAITNSDTTYSFKSTRDRTRESYIGHGLIGLDYFINDFQTLTFSAQYKQGFEDNRSTFNYEDFDEFHELSNTSARETIEDEVDYDIEGQINYLKTFDTKGKKWNTTLSFIQKNDIEDSDYIDTDFTANTTQLERSYNQEDEARWQLQSDYIHPFKKSYKWESGTDISLRKIVNDYHVESLNDNSWTTIGGLEDKLTYHEDIYAFYSMIGKKDSIWSYQLGLRAEYTDVRANLSESKITTQQANLQLFPTAAISLKKANNQFQLNYSRRINRPRFRSIIPFSNYNDNRNQWVGNPDLQPIIIQALEFNHIYYFNKGRVLSSLYYRYNEGIIERIAIVNEDGSIAQTPFNVGNKNNIGLEVNSEYRITPQWNLQITPDVFYTTTKASYNGNNLNFDDFNYKLNVKSKLKLQTGWNFSTSYDYVGPKLTTQGKRLSYTTWNFAVAKKLLKGKAQLTLAVKDILNTRKRRLRIDEDDLIYESDYQWRTRRAKLSFNYKIGK